MFKVTQVMINIEFIAMHSTCMCIHDKPKVKNINYIASRISDCCDCSSRISDC